MSRDSFAQAVLASRTPVELEVAGKRRLVYKVSAIPGAEKLPRSLVCLLENVVRNVEDDERAIAYAKEIVDAGCGARAGGEIEFMPARVLFQDFTGVPVFVDLAAMRDEISRSGGDPTKVNPHIPTTLVIDHSVVADCVGSESACAQNLDIEAERNKERFEFLKWASQSFKNVEIVPPGVGICHQLNIERFCEVVSDDALADFATPVACFDTLVGTDSHTPTANGIGVLGWGVGGIEAEAAALGQPITMLVPEVVELHLRGALGAGVSGMDLALTVAELLRAEGVVGCFVEVTGEGVASLSATQRACVSNMTPEYGATATLFPVDEQVTQYLRLTGRSEENIAFAKEYTKLQAVYGEVDGRQYARRLELDLESVEASLAGPSRPHERTNPAGLQQRFEESLAAHGRRLEEHFEVKIGEQSYELSHGTIAIAAITSCTTATDPSMMLACGLVAQKAVACGLKPKPWVKKVLAPGSRVTELLLKRAGLLTPLAQLGFFTSGFGCMTCIGNSGEILSCLKEHASAMELTSVLSGNRNFEGRINADVSQNYLCNPALVVAYSLAGTMDIDLTCEPLGRDSEGRDIMLTDILPTEAEVQAALKEFLTPELFAEGKASFDGGAAWQGLKAAPSATYTWDENSTYIRRPPYFELAKPCTSFSVSEANCLAVLGDFVTTDHISPAGSIALDSPAAAYLREHGTAEKDFNTYGARRGNHEVMMRGTFANVKLSNALAEGKVGSWTRNFSSGEISTIFEASEVYREKDQQLIVLAGKLYGSGSSRDWAAKGPALLGVRAVIAESLERIHRSNLIGMGILPLEFADGVSYADLGLDGSELFTIDSISLEDGATPARTVWVHASKPDGTRKDFSCVVRLDTPTEARYLAAGGILPYVLSTL